jgi:hypothetical protein
MRSNKDLSKMLINLFEMLNDYMNRWYRLGLSTNIMVLGSIETIIVHKSYSASLGQLQKGQLSCRNQNQGKIQLGIYVFKCS